VDRPRRLYFNIANPDHTAFRWNGILCPGIFHAAFGHEAPAAVLGSHPYGHSRGAFIMDGAFACSWLADGIQYQQVLA